MNTSDDRPRPRAAREVWRDRGHGRLDGHGHPGDGSGRHRHRSGLRRSGLRCKARSDQAVLAAAAELDGTVGLRGRAIDAAENYLDQQLDRPRRRPQDGGRHRPGRLRERGNGFMKCNKWRVELWAPTAKVNLGLAKAVTDQEGIEDINVPAHAAAEVRSPRLGTLPFYATPTCSIGQQVLSTDSNGHATPPVVPLSPDGGLNTLERDRTLAHQHPRGNARDESRDHRHQLHEPDAGSHRCRLHERLRRPLQVPIARGPRSSTATSITSPGPPEVIARTTSGTSASSRAATGRPTTATPRQVSRSSRSATRSSTATCRTRELRLARHRPHPGDQQQERPDLLQHRAGRGPRARHRSGRPQRAQPLQRGQGCVTAPSTARTACRWTRDFRPTPSRRA